jgi:hypothetical protein
MNARLVAGPRIAAVPGMRTLEARFHMPYSSGDYIVVGHVVWDGASDDTAARVEPSRSLPLVSAPATLFATLKHLVTMTRPRSFERLRALRSHHWSFVEVPEASQSRPLKAGRRKLHRGDEE